MSYYINSWVKFYVFSAQPLKNSSDTIVVVGGVHWLATSHLHTLMNILKRSVYSHAIFSMVYESLHNFREGLEGAKIVIKTLGAGFHIPADGVHLLSTVSPTKNLNQLFEIPVISQQCKFELDIECDQRVISLSTGEH